MSEVQLTLKPVAALPSKPVRNGPVGRPSPYTPVLEQIREQGPGQAYQITAAPLETEPDRAAQIANRIRNGAMAGIVGGEFDARGGIEGDEVGHVFVEYLGAEGIAAYEAKAPEREARKAARAANKAAKSGNQAAVEHVQADESITVDSAGIPVAPAQAEFASAGVDGW